MGHKKPFAYTEVSDKKCEVCGKQLKKNLIAKKPDANICYRDFRKKRLAKQKENVVVVKKLPV